MKQGKIALFMKASCFLLIAMLITGCVAVDLPEKTDIPEDFSFAITFNTYGISSYDSTTGRLVKTTDATHPEDYVTTLVFSEAELSEIRTILNGLNLNAYPAEYDPFNAPDAELRVMSEPSQTMILTVRSETVNKTITCRNVAHGGEGYNKEAEEFLDALRQITEKIYASEEWKALPDYEFLYE